MQSSLAHPPSSRIETEVKRLSGLMARRDFAAALSGAERLSAEVPENRDVLHILAASQRHLHRFDDAFATLARLERHHPGFSRLYEERGHCHIGAKSPGPAIDAFEQAVNLNSCLPSSWQALEALYRVVGRLADAERSGAQASLLASLPSEIRAAWAMFADGDVVLAEELMRSYITVRGEHVDALRLLAKIAERAGVEYDTELLLARALELAPANEPLRHEYAEILLKRHKHREALAEIDRLLTLAPATRAYAELRAAAAAGLGDYETALPLYHSLSAQSPEEPALQIALADALKSVGKTDEAIECYRRAAAGELGFSEAFWGLANLKTYRFTDEELSRMQLKEADPGATTSERYPLCFALGKALEDQGEFEKSFGFYERGNALKRSEVRYQPAALERTSALQVETCTREFFASRQSLGCDSAAPIFIVGLPRSGSTLIERILASHPDVEATPELTSIPRLALELGSTEQSASLGHARALGTLNAAACKRSGERYLAETRAYRAGGARFVDKTQNNFRHLDLISLILPNAKIIDVRREPMACGFSMYKQLFAAGRRFAYSVEDIARYYRMYVDLMAHWEQALPGKILRVQHEDVVDHLEPSVRRLLDFCGLEFDPACLEFHRTGGPVHGASSEQVRQPIFRDGLEHWRRYEPWLEPLRTAFDRVNIPHG